MINRAYTWLEIREIDKDKRIIEGIATTPVLARDGDILETAGISFKLPIPFLYRHKEPMGNVIAANVSSTGIHVRVQVGPAGISPALDEAWNLVNAGLVRGLSIGWRTIAETYDKAIGGYRIMKSEWLELSAVPVAADPNAAITAIRSADNESLVEAGMEVTPETKRPAPDLASETVVVSKKPGVAGKRKQGDRTMLISFDTQIQDFDTQLTDVRQQMTDLMEQSQDGILEGENARKYDELTELAGTLRTNIRRLQAHKENSEDAVVVPLVQTPPAREVVRPQARQTVEARQVEKDPEKRGIGVARMVIALIQARGNHHLAADLARQHFRDMPEVALALRAAVDAGDTTTSGWASQLVPAAQQMQGEFIDLLRPATLIGRIPGLRRVPFNVNVPLQSGGGTYNWVGEAKPKPVTSAAFASATLRFAKAAGIIVITRELARFSSPSAELIIRNELIKGCSQFLDGQFIDDAVAATNDHPASILNGIAGLTPSGGTAEAFRYDLSILAAAFTATNQDPTMAVLLISATTAWNLAMMRNALGNREFPDISMRGGSIDGVPVVVSQTVSDRMVLVNADDILVADDGVINVDVSEQASVEMSSTPLSGEESPIDGTIFRSLWQNNLVGLRVETFMTWKRARTSSVVWMDNVTYAPSQPSSPA